MSENDWEDVKVFTGLTNPPPDHGSFLRREGYEYRVQRRKKPDPIPEIKPGDYLVLADNDRWYVMKSEDLPSFEVVSVYCDGKLIWERK